MKKNLIATLLAGAALAPLTASAQVAAGAADGTITFSGNVQSSTCVIAVNNGTREGTVNLPTVRTTALTGSAAGAAGGQTAGETPFSIRLTGCTSASQTVSAFFSSTAANTAGRMRNTLSNGAQNVDLELLTNSSQTIDLNAPFGTQRSESAVLANGEGTLNYRVRYFATAQATSGLVRSNTTFFLNFQ